MHLVIIAWLYVTLTMALAMHSIVAGVALFVFIGAAPVMLIAALALRRARARKAEASGLEQEVKAADDGDA